MNYLAHLYLGRKTEASLVGNLLGDFIKGNEESLREQFPEEVVEGILMHRKIDKFTDAHKEFLAAKMLLSSRMAKYAGIIIDVIFDHFLAKHWDRYGVDSLETFSEHAHGVLLKHPEWHSDELAKRLPRLIDNQVLLGYRDKEGIQQALNAIAKRSNRSHDIADGYEDFLRNYDEFEHIFHAFFPALCAYASTLAPKIALDTEESEAMDDEDLILMWRQRAIVMAEKENRFETLTGHFVSKGISRPAAETAAKKIIADVKHKRLKQSKLLFLPGWFFILFAPTLALSFLFLPEGAQFTPFKCTIAGTMSLTIGLFFINKSKSIR